MHKFLTYSLILIASSVILSPRPGKTQTVEQKIAINFCQSFEKNQQEKFITNLALDASNGQNYFKGVIYTEAYKIARYSLDYAVENKDYCPQHKSFLSGLKRKYSEKFSIIGTEEEFKTENSGQAIEITDSQYKTLFLLTNIQSVFD